MEWLLRDCVTNEEIKPLGVRYAEYEVRRTAVEEREGRMVGVLFVELAHRWPAAP